MRTTGTDFPSNFKGGRGRPIPTGNRRDDSREADEPADADDDGGKLAGFDFPLICRDVGGRDGNGVGFRIRQVGACGSTTAPTICGTLLRFEYERSQCGRAFAYHFP